MKKPFKHLLNTLLSSAFAGAILWWMYRGFSWGDFSAAFTQDMSWLWMWLSFPFGILAQVLRAIRWRQMLASMGERIGLRNCIHSIYISYASSLVVPRAGEVLRCGVLHRAEGVSFSRLLGTVMSERAVDMLVVLFISSLTMFLQIPVFMHFCHETGLSLSGFLNSFTHTGYLVAGACLVVGLAVGILILYRINIFSRTRAMLNGVYVGALSVFRLKQPILFILYSFGIWAAYFLHFYLTFRCFAFTAGLGPMVAMVAFVVGCFAVLVPTPNGAGPWHFAVKTVLMLFGVSAADGAMFALVVHTLQTLLVAALGIYASVALSLKRK